MSEPLSVVHNQLQLQESLAAMRGAEGPIATITRMGGSLLEFAGVVFEGADIHHVFAAIVTTEPGPNRAETGFDVNGSLTSQEFPCIGVFNLADPAEVRVTRLPSEHVESYNRNFPIPTSPSAINTRRSMAELAFDSTDAVIGTGRLRSGEGLLLSQRPAASYVVHEITPLDANDPVVLVKLLVASNDVARATLRAQGYNHFGKLVEDVLRQSVKPTVVTISGLNPGVRVILSGGSDEKPTEVTIR